MFDTTEFLSDPTLNKIHAGFGDIDPIPILCANTLIAGMPTLFGLVSHYNMMGGVDRDHNVPNATVEMDDRLTVRFLNIQDVDHI